MFLSDGERIDDIVSTTTDEVKQINIITYQSLTRSSRDNDTIFDKIIDCWFDDVNEDFSSKDDFINYTLKLKELEAIEYSDNIRKYKKKLKLWNNDLVSQILSVKVLDYFEKLKKLNIKSIVVDEAHHLTNWWSKSVYYLWNELWKASDKLPYIIWLTATPPYENSDFFILDDDYSKLLWEVDYYIPTPAIIKSWRLAPYSDLVYFVEPDDSLKKSIDKTDKILDKFIKDNKKVISNHICELVEKKYNILLWKSWKILLSYLKFLKTYSNFNITPYYFSENISDKITLDDIAKTIWSYTYNLSLSLNNKNKVDSIKKIFYELWYIWRGKNFYRFRTKIENMLIYGRSKINWIKDILDKEINNLWWDLKCAIITDFLEEKEAMISCKTILKSLSGYKKLNPILVSWQGIWKIWEDNELETLDTDILEVTKWLSLWETKLIIWTRWILWEWWDCPKLNTLIDLTWIVAYMSVNQVRWRAIRLDKDNLSKVANIYDIVTIYDSYSKDVDLSRLERKHEQFYWVDDTGLIIKWINHIYPNLIQNISEYKKINKNMLKRSEMRSYYQELWGIDGKYQNKEVFWLNLEITDLWKFFPFVNFRIYDTLSFFKLIWNKKNLETSMKSTFYIEIIRRFLQDFLKNIVKTLKTTWELPKDFKFKLIKWQLWNFKLVSSYIDDLVVKKFMLDVSVIFKTVTDEKYVLNYPFAYLDNNKMKERFVAFAMPNSLSKNSDVRKVFKKEILNDHLYKKLLINSGSLIDKGIKIPLLWIWWFFILPSLFAINPILVLLWFWAWGTMFFMPFFYENRIKIINDYKKLFERFKAKSYKFKPKLIYLNNKYIEKDKFIWKKPFIEAKIDKIWL